MGALYDRIGVGYAGVRQPDSSIQKVIIDGLGDTVSVVNVGAGAGSYEPANRNVIAVELSMEMIRQRPPTAAPVVQATATALPFADDVFDASLAILTVHHWPDKRCGLVELRRVARKRVVIFTWDPKFPGFWLTDYIPEVLDIDRPIFPSIDTYEEMLGPVSVTEVSIPANCSDGFMCAYWRRPEAYLDRRVRSAISTFSKIGDVAHGLRRLRRDLGSGEWSQRYGHITGEAAIDLGYRLIVAEL